MLAFVLAAAGCARTGLDVDSDASLGAPDGGSAGEALGNAQKRVYQVQVPETIDDAPVAGWRLLC